MPKTLPMAGRHRREDAPPTSIATTRGEVLLLNTASCSNDSIIERIGA
jgi:hypothetical protein